MQRPDDIEAQSFQIIEAEAGPHDFNTEQWNIVKRMIHTTADFDYKETVRFHPDAIVSGIRAIKDGKPIITDTQMVKVGIRQQALSKYGVQVSCFIQHPKVIATAKESGKTRAHVAVDAAAQLMTDGIYAIGNAPTALLRLIELVNSGKAKPALIIGLPVGFVNAVESKSKLLQMQCPHISNIGRKGGSNLAASVVNALVLMIK